MDLLKIGLCHSLKEDLYRMEVRVFGLLNSEKVKAIGTTFLKIRVLLNPNLICSQSGFNVYILLYIKSIPCPGKRG